MKITQTGQITSGVGIIDLVADITPNEIDARLHCACLAGISNFGSELAILFGDTYRPNDRHNIQGCEIFQGFSSASRDCCLPSSVCLLSGRGSRQKEVLFSKTVSENIPIEIPLAYQSKQSFPLSYSRESEDCKSVRGFRFAHVIGVQLLPHGGRSQPAFVMTRFLPLRPMERISSISAGAQSSAVTAADVHTLICRKGPA